MSMPYLDPEEPFLESVEPMTPLDPSNAATAEVPLIESVKTEAIEPEAPRDGWSLIALIPHDGKEPPADLGDQQALAAWCAVSAPWHPALLARSQVLPRIESIESPSSPGPREVRIIADGSADRLPSGYRTQAEDAGAVLLDSGTDRADLVGRIRARIGIEASTDPVETDPIAAAARDFLALGTVRWMLRDLAVAMGHAESVDRESLWRELMAGAHAWQIGDCPAAVNRLRAAYEVLTQARERFYPVDAYILDLCLLDPAMTGGMLADPLATAVPITFVASARAIENQSAVDPDAMAALRQAINDGWVDIAGGTYSEAEDALLPLESILWQYRHGAEVYRANLDERNVETYARRRFGLFMQLPQIAKRFAIRYALHMSFDAGRFPVRPETKRLWESPDGSSLESLLRPPLAADRASQGWLLPWRMGATMRDDHVAAVPLVHWPTPVAPWYQDLRRVATYSPVLGRWTTLNDFFHLTDRPYETFRPEPDTYATPYLAQSVAQTRTRAHLAIGPASSTPCAARGGADDPGPGPRTRIGGRRPGCRTRCPRRHPIDRGDRGADRDRPIGRGGIRAGAVDPGLGGIADRTDRRSRRRPCERRQAAGVSRDQPRGSAPTRHGHPPRRRPRPPTRRAPEDRPVHGRRRLRGGRSARFRLRLGARPRPIRAVRRPPRADSRHAVGSSATSRSRSTSTRRPAASEASRASARHRRDWGSNWRSSA